MKNCIEYGCGGEQRKRHFIAVDISFAKGKERTSVANVPD